MQVFKLINIHEFREQFHIPDAKFVNYQVAYDGRIYMILSADKYYFFRITFDWNVGTILDIEQFDFSKIEHHVKFWCPYFDYFLLVSLSVFSTNKESNAWIVDKDGNILESIYISDAIEDCYTTPNGRIIAGYMDMSIDEPRDKGAKGGVTIWNDKGRWIWRNRKYDVWHCYALNIDYNNLLWFYYYGRFNDKMDNIFHLVCKNKRLDAVFTTDIEGSDGFAVSADYRRLLLGGGYRDKESVYMYDMDYENQKLLNKRRVIFKLDGKEIEFYDYEFSQNKVFLLMEDGTLVTGCLDNE